MGLISRKIFPACGSMCVCCPALRPRSRHPVKRYKKILAEIFPKSPEGAPNDRKIIKLCEYATRNPFRIPKIVQYLEERCHKELRCGHIKFVNIVAEVYSKLLSMCNGQMVYFAGSLLNMVSELLENTKQVDIQILGCQTLTKFIYSQADGTYTHSIEKFVQKICTLAKTNGEENQRRCLRAASLQCISAMVWFMTQFSYIFPALDEIVHVTLDNYEQGLQNENDRGEPHRNLVDEVVRLGGRVGGTETSPNCIAIRPRPEKKDPSSLTRNKNYIVHEYCDCASGWSMENELKIFLCVVEMSSEIDEFFVD